MHSEGQAHELDLAYQVLEREATPAGVHDSGDPVLIGRRDRPGRLEVDLAPLQAQDVRDHDLGFDVRIRKTE
jgi:hypothetical protein